MEQQNPLGPVITGHGARREDHGGIYVEKLFDDLDAGRVTTGFAVYEPGAATGPHGVVKPGMEYLFLLEGELIAEIDGIDYPMAPGDYVHFPTTIPHRGWNPGTETARAYYLNYVPAGDATP